MKTRCKPGDLAIIIDAFERENIGRIVEIIRQARDGEFWNAVGAQVTWIIRSARPILCSNKGGKTSLVMERPFADEFLRPISGVPVEDEVLEDLKEPV